MDNYVKVARAHRIIAAIYGLLTIFCVYSLFFDSESVNSILGLAIFSVVIGILFIAHLAASIGASNAKPWARTLSIVIAIPLLFGFPAGTVAGIYILMNSNAEWKIKKYDSKLLEGWPT